MVSPRAEQRQDRQDARHLRETVEEGVTRPEEDAGPQDRGLRESLPDGFLALGAGPHVAGTRAPVRTDAGDMHQARTDPGSMPSDTTRPFDVDRLEGVAAPLQVEPHRIDHRLGAIHGGGDRRLVANIRGDQLGLAGSAGRSGIACDDAYGHAIVNQARDDAAAEETTPAEHRRDL